LIGIAVYSDDIKVRNSIFEVCSAISFFVAQSLLR
jgi:hypothetical protein